MIQRRCWKTRTYQKEGRKYQTGVATSLMHICQRASLSSSGCGLGLTFRRGSKKSSIREECCPSIYNVPPAIVLILKHLEKGPCAVHLLELCSFSSAL